MTHPNNPIYRKTARTKRKQLSGISIEMDQFDDVKALAERRGWTISEAFRNLVEWGLEAECQ